MEPPKTCSDKTAAPFLTEDFFSAADFGFDPGFDTEERMQEPKKENAILFPEITSVYSESRKKTESKPLPETVRSEKKKKKKKNPPQNQKQQGKSHKTSVAEPGSVLPPAEKKLMSKMLPKQPRKPSGHIFSIDPGGAVLFAAVSDSPESVPILLKNPLRVQDIDLLNYPPFKWQDS